MSKINTNPLMRSVINETVPQSRDMEGRRMERSDVVTATIITLCVVIFSAVSVFWIGGNIGHDAAVTMNLIGVVGVVALGLAMGFSKAGRSGSMIMTLILAVFQGFMVGGLSYTLGGFSIGDSDMSSIIPTAVAGTIIVFVLTVTLYGMGIIRVNEKWRGRLYVAIGAMGLMYLLNLGSSLIFGKNFLFMDGPLPIIFGIVAIFLAAFSILDDLGLIDQATVHGVPEKMKWSFAGGIVAGLVWLYMEILRLLYLTNRN